MKFVTSGIDADIKREMIVVKNRARGDTNSVAVVSENKIEDMIQKELVEEIERFILQLKFVRHGLHLRVKVHGVGLDMHRV